MINATGNPGGAAVDKLFDLLTSCSLEFDHQLSRDVPPPVRDHDSEQHRRLNLASISNAERDLVRSLSTVQRQRNRRLRVGFSLEEKEGQQGGGGSHEELDPDSPHTAPSLRTLDGRKHGSHHATKGRDTGSNQTCAHAPLKPSEQRGRDSRFTAISE